MIKYLLHQWRCERLHICPECLKPLKGTWGEGCIECNKKRREKYMEKVMPKLKAYIEEHNNE